MSKVPFESKQLGELELIEVFLYHDIPRLFSLKTLAGAFYLAQCVDEIRDSEDGEVQGECWLLVPTSIQRLEAVRTGRVSLHDAFRFAEGGVGTWVEARYNEPCFEKAITLAELDPDLFHAENVKLSMPPSRVNFDNLRSSSEAARAYRQTIGTFIFGNGEHVALGLKPVGSFLEDLEGVLVLLRKKDEQKARFSVCAAWTGSLGLQIRANRGMAGSFFGLTEPEGKALDALIGLLSANYQNETLEEALTRLEVTVGPRLKQRFIKLVKTLKETGHDVYVEWATPTTSESESVKIAHSDLSSLHSRLLEAENEQPSEELILCVGMITSFNKPKSTVTIQAGKERYTKVNFSRDQRALTKGFHTESKYLFELLSETSTNAEGEVERADWLVSSSPIEKQ